MTGAPAGPALDPERPADRLDAFRETDESEPVRQARRAQPRRTRAAPLTITSSDRPSKREVEPAREKRERVAARLREDPLPHALVEWPFVPILPRLCCWAERKARARALLDDRESLSKGRAAPVNLSSCSLS